jgi:hypothetical protein
MNQHQGLGLAHRVQDQGVDRVVFELLERGDPLAAIDYQILGTLLNDEDWGLLSALSQRCQQMPESRRLADPEVLQPAVQLMKFQCLRHSVALEVQYARVGIGSFAAEPGSCVDLS